jgi:hypothetical protein
MWHGLASAVFGPLHVNSSHIEVVLHGKIFGPDRWVVDGVVQLNHAIERIPGLLLTLEDIDQKRGDCDCGDRSEYNHGGE